MEELDLYNVQTMSSREIAELTGKNHADVIRDIRKLNESYIKLRLSKVAESSYLNSQNKLQPMFELTKIQTFDLMTGYNTELRIKVNRRWEELENKHTLDFTDANAVLQLAQNWAEEQNRRKELEIQNKELKPKADEYDRFLNSEGLLDIGETAKVLRLTLGRNNLFKLLRDKGIFFKNRNEPMQEYVDREYFVVKPIVIQINGKDVSKLKVFVTKKGLKWLSKILINYKKPPILF